MESLYQQALSLYNQCDYEGAWDLLHNADLKDQREISLFKECEKLVVEKAVITIRSYVEEGQILKAKNFKINFFAKYGYHASVRAVKIPEPVLLSQEVDTTSRGEDLQIFLIILVVGILVFGLIYFF